MMSDDDIKTAQASAAAHRGHVTRATKELDRVAESVSDHPTERSVQAMLSTLVRFESQSTKAEEAYMMLMAIDPDKDKQATYKSRLDEICDTRAQVVTRTNRLADRAEETMRAAINANPPQVVHQGPSQPKVCAALKPKQLTIENTPTELRSWRLRYTAYHTTSQFDTYDKPEQHMFMFAVLDHDMENRVREHDKYHSQMDVLGDVDSLLEIIEEEFIQRYPLFNRRLEYFRLAQKVGQEFSAYALELKQKGDEADLHRLDTDSLHVFRYITGVTDQKLREKFFRLVDPKLEDLKRTVRAYEAGKHAQEAMAPEKVRAAYVAGNKRPSRPLVIPPHCKGKCLRCGARDHERAACPKKWGDLKCGGCGKQGHHKSVCLQEGDAGRSKAAAKQATQSRPPSRNASPSPHTSDDDSDDPPERAALVRCAPVGTKSRKSKPTPTCPIVFGNKDRRFTFWILPDTGCTRTIIAKDVLEKYSISWQTTKSGIYVADDRSMDCTGKVTLSMYSRCGVPLEAPMQVQALVSTGLTNEILMSWHDLQDLGILHQDFPCVVRRTTDKITLTVNQLKTAFKDVVRNDLEQGKVMKGLPMVIQVRSDVPVKPVRKLTARPIPLHYRKEADRMVKELIREGILAKVTDPTEWISAGHFVPKPDKKRIRLVTDYVDLNKYVQRPVHPFPSTQDILQNISAGSKWFAKLDAVHGYFQIPLDEASSYMTTFLLPSGRYRYLRAPMGLSASGDEFCQRSDRAIEGLEYCQKIVDDILITAETEDQLLERVREVLQRCREHGMTISEKKLEVGQSVKFAGHVVGVDGVRPDPERLAAIKDFPSPTNLTQLRSFLGLANQLSSFVPDTAHCTVKMRQLMKKQVAYQWLPDHESEFVQVKNMLTSPTLVKYFDPSLPTVILTDASRLYGLGFALVQVQKDGTKALVKCGSTSLSSAETRYATIELELLAIEYAVRKCRFYLRGMNTPFNVITDHRPLVGVFNKSLHMVDNPRLQRLRGKLDGSGYVFTVEWDAGKNNLIADALSRSPIFTPDAGTNVDFRVCQVKDLSLEPLLKAATAPEYQQCVEALRSDKRCEDLPPHHPGRRYKEVWHELSLHVEDSESVALMLYQGDRIVIPVKYRQEVLKLLHLPHAGITKTRKAAQQLYYWPSMSTDVKQLVEACTLCQELQASQPLEPIVDLDLGEAPMQAVGVDLCEYAGVTWLVMVDRHSGFPFACVLKKLNTSAVTARLLAWFRDWGFPITLRSDGGPQFRSEFGKFCKEWGIVHQLSSPYNPRGNGLAEAAVKNVKKLVKKTTRAKESFSQALFEFRNLPREDGYSPAQMMLGRRQRGRLPTLAAALQQVDQKDASSTRRQLAKRGAENHNDHARRLQKLEAGQQVYLQNPTSKLWDVTGEVTHIREDGRSYEVRTAEGTNMLRNRRYLRKKSCLKPAGEEVQGQQNHEVSQGQLDDSANSKPEKAKGAIRRSSRIAAQKKVHFN